MQESVGHVPVGVNIQQSAALLSAASASQASGLTGDMQIPALLDVGGEAVISHQIRALRQFGIEHFFIEVDQVPGSLLAICDKARQNGAIIDFVRSPQELAQKLPVASTLFTQAEGVVADPKLLADLSANSTPFIATVDGREENSGFERMDLNTRWAGLARFDSATVASVANLPAGWSIASSLLRQAMQQGVVQKPLKQVQLQDQKLSLVAEAADADAMTQKLLSVRAAKAGGIVESSIFGAASKWIAPLIWRNPAAKKAVPAVSIAAAFSSVGLAVFDFDALAAIVGLLSIFGFSVLTTMSSRDEGGLIRRFAGPVIWILLIAALGAALWRWPGTAVEDLFPAVMLVGLMVHSRKAKLPRRAKRILGSPALVVFLFWLFAVLQQAPLGTKMLASAYLLGLIVADFWQKKDLLKTEQP